MSAGTEIERTTRVEWGWQYDEATPYKESSEAEARSVVTELNRIYPGDRYRVVSRNISDWVAS